MWSHDSVYLSRVSFVRVSRVSVSRSALVSELSCPVGALSCPVTVHVTHRLRTSQPSRGESLCRQSLWTHGTGHRHGHVTSRARVDDTSRACTVRHGVGRLPRPQSEALVCPSEGTPAPPAGMHQKQRADTQTAHGVRMRSIPCKRTTCTH